MNPRLRRTLLALAAAAVGGVIVLLLPSQADRGESNASANPVVEAAEPSSTPVEESEPASTTLVASSAAGNTPSTIRVTGRPRLPPDGSPAYDPALAPRQAHPKGPLAVPPGERLEVEIKFHDHFLARAAVDGSLAIEGDATGFLAGIELPGRVEFRPAFGAETTGKLALLQARAAAATGERQPDLAGTVVAVLPGGSGREESIAVARAFHGRDEVEYVGIVSLDQPVPPPGDIAPPTPDLVSLQGYRRSEASTGGADMDYAFSRGFRGQGVRVSDCEYGFNILHEDFADGDITDSSRGPYSGFVFTNGWDRHGTAAVGISGAVANGYGMTGIADLAEIHFYSEHTSNGGRRADSVTDAIADSDFGDVVLLEMQAGDGNGDFVPAEYSSTIWNIVKLGTDAGVIVVAAAGNGGVNLDDPAHNAYRARGDSGAIIVGAGNQDGGHGRKSFSTYGDRVDVQGWGGGVASTGYGSYAEYGGDKNQRYTNGFSGTSSASAVVAPCVAVVQSYCEQALGYRLGPAAMRTLLESTGEQPATDQRIGPHVNIRNALDYFAPPTSLTASDDLAGHVLVEWSGTAGATGYQIYRGPSTDPGQAALVATVGATTAWTDSEPLAGFAQHYFARAVTPVGLGEWSSPDEGRALGFPIELSSASDTGASDSDLVTRDRTPVITGLSTPGLAIAVSSDRDGIVGTATAAVNGTWSVELSPLSEGTHRIVAVENGGVSSYPLEIEIDITPPPPPAGLRLLAADDTGSSDSDGVTRSTTVRLTGTTSGGSTVAATLDGHPIGSATPTGGTFAITAGPLGEGTYRYSATAADLAGNWSDPAEPFDLRIDTTGPEPTIRPAPGQGLFVVRGPIDFQITFPEPVFGLSGGDVVVTGSSSNPSLWSGPTVFQVRISQASAEGPVFVALPGGAASDLAGNPSAAATGADQPVHVDAAQTTPVDLSEGFDTLSGWLSIGDRDEFRIELDSPRHLRLSTSGLSGLIESITGDGGMEHHLRDGGADGDGVIEIALPAGEFLIVLSGAVGDENGAYELEIILGDEAVSRPDARVGRSLAADAGNDLYGSPAGQTFTIVSRRARAVRGTLGFENDGEFAESYRAGAAGGDRLFRVVYLADGRNVTADLLAFRHRTGMLVPGGAPESVATTVRPSRRALVRRTPRGLSVRRAMLRLPLIVAGAAGTSDRAELRVSVR